MKNKKSVYLMSGIFGFGFILMALLLSSAQIADSYKLEQQNDLVLKVNVPKQNYIKGEMISLEVEVVNTSSSDISLKGASIESGYVKIFVSPSSLEFKQNITGGVRKKTKGIVISGGETIKSQATILWNFVPDIKNLSDGAVKAYSENQLMTNYAFPNAGIYFVKAVLIIPGEIMTKIESEPVQIIVREPVGNDLEVWNLVKNNSEIAYFIQYDEIQTFKMEKQEKVLEEIEQIITKYPTSFLGSQMKQSLIQFRANETKRKQFMENLRQQRKN